MGTATETTARRLQNGVLVVATVGTDTTEAANAVLATALAPDFSSTFASALADSSSPQLWITTQEALTTLVALPSASILQRPAHSPSSIWSSTVMIGTPCSVQSAATSFL